MFGAVVVHWPLLATIFFSPGVRRLLKTFQCALGTNKCIKKDTDVKHLCNLNLLRIICNSSALVTSVQWLIQQRKEKLWRSHWSVNLSLSISRFHTHICTVHAVHINPSWHSFLISLCDPLFPSKWWCWSWQLECVTDICSWALRLAWWPCPLSHLCCTLQHAVCVCIYEMPQCHSLYSGECDYPLLAPEKPHKVFRDIGGVPWQEVAL